jgi:hypothetical protein
VENIEILTKTRSPFPMEKIPPTKNTGFKWTVA